jgi:5'(3')-deoxyribonucleotidase
VFVTAVPANYEVRVSWLLSNFSWCTISNIVFAHNKALISGDYFIDDKLSNIYSWAADNGGHVLCFTQPHNESENFNGPHCINRVNNWEEVVEFIEEKEDGL